MKKGKSVYLVFSVFLLLLLSFTSSTPISAMEKDKNNETTLKLKNGDVTALPNLEVIEEDIDSKAIICCFYNKKYDVKNSTEWTGYKRVSDNVVTKNYTGSVTANKSVTYSASISGSATWADVGIGSSKSSSKSYTMNVPKNSRVFLGYRMKYKVERGKKCRAHVISKKCTTKGTSYTIKRPSLGEYALRNY